MLHSWNLQCLVYLSQKQYFFKSNSPKQSSHKNQVSPIKTAKYSLPSTFTRDRYKCKAPIHHLQCSIHAETSISAKENYSSPNDAFSYRCFQEAESSVCAGRNPVLHCYQNHVLKKKSCRLLCLIMRSVTWKLQKSGPWITVVICWKILISEEDISKK